MFPRVGALQLLECFWGLVIWSSTSFSLLMSCADIGEVNRNLNACHKFRKQMDQQHGKLALTRIALRSKPSSISSSLAFAWG
jgi:hypothetical protein